MQYRRIYQVIQSQLNFHIIKFLQIQMQRNSLVMDTVMMEVFPFTSKGIFFHSWSCINSFLNNRSNQLLEKNLFQEVQNLFSSSSETKKPDVLIIQVGHQACHLPYLEESKNTEYDKTYTSKAETNIKTFFTSLKELIDKSKSTKVIISLPSRSLLGNSDSDYCTWRLNRIIAYEAHVKGFIVLEKEEIETRLLFRTERAIDPVKTMKSLISFPGSQIIAASLIHLLNCLEQKLVFTL